MCRTKYSVVCYSEDGIGGGGCVSVVVGGGGAGTALFAFCRERRLDWGFK